MAEETVDRCVKVCKLKAGKSLTKGLLLEGAHEWTPTMFIRLIQDFGLDHKVLSVDHNNNNNNNWSTDCRCFR